MFFIQIIFIAQDNLASRGAEGSVTALVYGWLFMQVPESLIGTALGVALLPTLAEQFARADEAAFRRSINQAVRVIVALTLPAAALLATGVEPVIGLLNFDAADTRLVAWTARAFLAGLVGHALLEVAGRSFYAQQNARTPLYTAMAALGVFIVLGVALAGAFGAPGIGLANSAAFTSSALILLYLLNRRYPGILALRGTLWRALAAAGLGAAVTYLLANWLPLPGVVAALGGMIAGGLTALPFILPELRLLLKL
jgi:putative peptidoglycan lipid II flippase